MKKFVKISKFLLIFSIIFALIFSGFPRIFDFPPKTQEARAAAPGQYTTSALKVAPSAAAGVSVSPSGTAWANSNWVQIIPSTANAIVVVGLVVGAGPSVEFEFDIGKGPSGSETVVATISGNTESAASSPRWLMLPIPVDNIPASTRVAVRVRKAGTGTTAYAVKLIYYNKPISGSIGVTVNPSLVAPSAAAGVSVTPSGTAWANSAWTQIIASTEDAIALGGITINPAVAAEYEIDVGTGAPGSEITVTTIRGRSATAGSPQTIILKPLLDNIASGERVSVRLRKAGTNTTAWTVKLIYYNKTSIGVDLETLTTKPLKWAPTAAAGASVAISGTAWANSNWVQLIASTASALSLAAVEFVPAAAVDFEIEFGIGAAGSEVPIGVVRGGVLSTTLGNIFTMNIAPLINSVPAGSRLAVRIRTSGTTTTAWNISVGYYEVTDTTNALNAPHLALPAAADSVSISNSATAWANSSYVELTSGLEDTVYLTRVAVRPSAATQFEVDIATGPSGSETVQTTVAGQAISLTGNSIIDLPQPLQVAANTRIAMRIRTGLTTAGTWTLALEYVPDEQIKQSAYRLFNNSDSTNVGTPLAAQDTAATLGSAGAAFRLRMLLHMSTNKLAIVSGQQFKLQFAQRGTDNLCDTAFSGETYADVTAATVIAYNDNFTPADGAALTANANDPTHGSDTIVNQTYEEANNFTNSVAAIPSGQDGKWDFSLKDNGAPADTTYCFRIVKSDGTLLDTYSVIPQITTATAAVVSVSVSDGVVSYGIMPTNTSKSTLPGELNDMQTATNDGNVTENFNIKGQDATGGGCTWTLASTNGTDQYVHQFCNDTDYDCTLPPTNYTALTTTYQSLKTGVSVNGTVQIQFRLITPTQSTCFGQQSVNITILAVEQ